MSDIRETFKPADASQPPAEDRDGTSVITVDDQLTVDDLYQHILQFPSDIQIHLPILHELAKQVKTVTELGVRTAQSTIAFLAAYPERLISWDIEPQWIQRALLLTCLKRGTVPAGRWQTSFQGRVGDTTKISSIEPVDFCFFDTLHDFDQLRSELKRHGNQARRFLAFHDTSPDAFGYKDETAGSKGPGLRAAIREFQQKTAPRWQMIVDNRQGAGLVVLQRHDTPFYPFFGAEFLEPPKEAVNE